MISMKRLAPFAAVMAFGAVAACSNANDDVVQAPAPGEAPVPVSNERADTALDNTAVYFGMTRKQLEDADLKSSTGVDLGDVETLVLDASGRLTHLVVELDGPGDQKVQVPVGDLFAIDVNGDKDVGTNLTAAQLQALPAWAPTTTVTTTPVGNPPVAP